MEDEEFKTVSIDASLKQSDLKGAGRDGAVLEGGVGPKSAFFVKGIRAHFKAVGKDLPESELDCDREGRVEGRDPGKA